ncbi:MAG: molybdopterin-dependent oxidoreductase, partial [Alphaproteobacteria bacterium]|nr:molybdopterin-dependent oxidoreductase [Alphaproteobacteria bacterium]
LMKGFIGSGNIDTNSRLCMSSSVAGHVRAFGEDVVPGCYDDIEEADLVVQVGSNMAWCHPVLYQRLMAARTARGTAIVTIDPRRTATAETADLHLALKPGSDVTLFNGLLVWLDECGVLDHDWIARHVCGFADALDAARRDASSIDAVAAATELHADDLRRFYTLFARTERAVTFYSQGVNQSVCGTDKVNTILNCHLATARIGRPGMGPFSLTGQPNAMGGREVGGLANQLAAHGDFTPADIDRVRRYWNAPNIATRPGLKAVELFEAVADGRVKAIWIAATNPAVSMPRAGRVREALAKCPLVIVSDAWPTDTTALADIILPAASWAEKDGTVTNSERRISRQRAFRAAPGEARPDWWMFAEVGRRLGWAEAFTYAGPAAIFREHAALSAFENGGRRVFDLGGLAALDDRQYDALGPVQWPCPADGPASDNARLFADGRFPTSDGRARMVPITSATGIERPGDMLVLNTGRLRDQWHTMTRTGRVVRLMAHEEAPLLGLNPGDAAARGIEDGGLVRIESRYGEAVLRARLDPALRGGAAFLPMHWTDQFSSAGPAGRLVHALSDPISGQPDLKGTAVRVRSVVERWCGLLLRQDDGAPRFAADVLATKAPIVGGFAFALSGWGALEDFARTERALHALLALPVGAEIIAYSDPKKSVFRYAGVASGRLLSCLFLGAPGSNFAEAEPARGWLGKELTAESRLSLLAGREASLRGGRNMVCACFAIEEGAIREAIRAGRLTSTAEIGDVLGAGTNCGSCIPELKKLLAPSGRLAEVA